MMRCFFLFLVLLNPLINPVKAQSLFENSFPGAGAAAMAIGGLAPAASLHNPAALALNRDINFNFVANTPFHLDFVGASSFFPRVGTFSLSLSQFQIDRIPVLPDSLEDDNRILERATFAIGKSLGNKFLFGFSMHASRMEKKDFGTATLSLMFVESRDQFLTNQYRQPELFINSFKYAQKYSLMIAYHDLSFNKKNLRGFTEIGMHYRHHRDWPFLYSTIRTTGHDEKINIGLGLELSQTLTLFSTYEDLGDFAFGGSFTFGRQILSLGYSHEKKKFVADFSFRISRAPSRKAQKYWQKGVNLSRRGSYKFALREIKKYRAYNPLDKNSLQLENWLQNKVKARKEKIDALLKRAQELVASQKYIKADLCYIEILTIDKNNHLARAGIEQIAPAVDNNVLAIARLGKIAFDKGSYAAAQRAFFAIKQVRPEHAEAKLYLQKIRDYYFNEAEKLFLRGLGYYNQKNYKMAVLSFEEALEQSTEHLESEKYLKKARTSLQWQKKESARILTRAKRFVRKNNYKKASELYQKILELDPQNQVAKNELRVLKPKLKRYIDHFVSKGKSAFKKGELEVAKSYFEKAYALDESADARQYLGKISSIKQERIDSDFQNGETAFAKKNWQEAIHFYDAVLQQDETHMAARNKRKMAYQNSDFDDLLKNADDKIAKKGYLEAYELYLALQERDPNNAYIQAQVDTCRLYLQEEVERYFNAGISFFAGENYESAIKEWDAVLRIDPHHAKSIEYKKKAEQRLRALNRL